MEQGSSAGASVGNSSLGSADRVLKDPNMPDGEACRPDGTLKDASELEFPNSPSDAPRNLPELSVNRDEYFFLNMKRKLPSNDSDDDTASDDAAGDEEDSDDEMEDVVGPRSKGKKNVSRKITPQIIKYLLLFPLRIK
jgi:hypothetical protein